MWPWKSNKRQHASAANTGKAVVLLYHRVIDLPTDPQWLAVTPERFAEHMHILARDYQPMTASQLARNVADKTLPQRAVVVTFDDGYADNFTHALPILERHSVPATCFVTSGQVDSDREFWWDELERLILVAEQLPEALTVDIGNQRHQWNLTGWTRYDERCEAVRDWNATQEPLPTPRHVAYMALCRLVKPLSVETREAVLTQLREQLPSDATARPTHHAMTGEQLHAFASSNLIEIGGHTVSHVKLADQSVGTQRCELRKSRVVLQSITGQSIDTMSYPFGAGGDFDRRTMRIARRAGYTLGFANVEGIVRSDCDRFALPRMLVRDIDGESFSRQLQAAFEPAGHEPGVCA